MVVGAKVCDLTEDLLWFVCGLYVGSLTYSLSEFYMKKKSLFLRSFPSVSLNEQLEIEETKVNHPINFLSII